MKRNSLLNPYNTASSDNDTRQRQRQQQRRLHPTSRPTTDETPSYIVSFNPLTRTRRTIPNLSRLGLILDKTEYSRKDNKGSADSHQQNRDPTLPSVSLRINKTSGAKRLPPPFSPPNHNHDHDRPIFTAIRPPSIVTSIDPHIHQNSYLPKVVTFHASDQILFTLSTPRNSPPHFNMKARPVDQIVYECMFPKPKSTDPQNFQGLLSRNLVPEVRLETQAFYGHLSSQEAKYPGLDYSHGPHRVRLSRYPWHRRLFRALDALGLTNHEIANLTKWEGTRWAKERFEKEQGIVIRDTTGDGIEDWVEPEYRVSTLPQAHRADVEDMEDIQEDGETDNEMEEDEGEDSDVELESVGVDLNRRLRDAAAQREAGNVGTVMDEEWEQWLKEAAENGSLPFPDVTLSPSANVPGTRPVGSVERLSMDPRLLNAGRMGQWQQIPEFLHNMVQENIQAHTRRLNAEANATTSSPIGTDPYRSSSSTRSRALNRHTSEVGRLTNLHAFSRRPIPQLQSTGLGSASRRPSVRLGVSGSTPQAGGN